LKELLLLEKDGIITPDHTSQALENRLDIGLSFFGFEKDVFLPFLASFGAVVVGSFPLALGHPRSFVPNDLDIACPRGTLEGVVDALTEFGFCYVPDSVEDRTMAQPLPAVHQEGSTPEEEGSEENASTASDVGSVSYSKGPSPIQPLALQTESLAYPLVPHFSYARQGMAIKNVVKMHRTLPSGRIAVVNVLESSSDSAVTPVFLFHSTLVMSYVAFHGLVIPYPLGYLEGQGYVNVPSRPMKEKTSMALKKYRDRGFTILDSMEGIPHMCGRNSSCPATLRSLLDGQTAHYLFPSSVDISPMNMAAVRLGKFLPMIRKDFEGGEVLRWKLAGGARCNGGTIEDPGYVMNTSGVFCEFF
jgi:hypothetical protein